MELVQGTRVSDFCDGHGLADPVDHVGDVDEPGARGDGLLIGADDDFVVFNGEIEADLLVDDAVALGALAVSLDHVRVVLLGADDFVAGLEGEAEDDGVEGFGGVAVDGDLVGMDAGEVGELLAEGFAALVEDLPHVVGRAFIGELVVALDGLLDDDGRGRDAAVVEIDDVRIDGVGALDEAPEIFILGNVGGAEMGDGAGGDIEVGGVDLVEEAGGAECIGYREGSGDGGGATEEGAAVGGRHRKKCRRLGWGTQRENCGDVGCSRV